MRVFVIVLVFFGVVMGEVSVQINIGQSERVVVPSGYVERNDCNRDVYFISSDVIGFYVQLNSGKYVLHCRNVYYNDESDVVYYGPWRKQYDVVYRDGCRRYDDGYYREKKRRGHGHRKSK